MRYSKSTASRTVKLKGYRSSKPKKEGRVTPAGAYSVINSSRAKRGDRTVITCAVPKYIVINGVPHKLINGVTVPMTPAKDSKKWDIVEA